MKDKALSCTTLIILFAVAGISANARQVHVAPKSPQLGIHAGHSSKIQNVWLGPAGDTSVSTSEDRALYWDPRNVSEQGERVIEQWKQENAEFIRQYGSPGDVRIQVSAWYLHFERGLIVYDITNAWSYIFFYETGLYRQVSNPKVLLTQHHSSLMNETLFENLMRPDYSAQTKEKYKKLLNDRSGKHIIGGIGTIYVREGLLDQLGNPLSTEDYFDDLVHAYGNERYILIANLLMRYEDEQSTLAFVLFPDQRRFRIDAIKLAPGRGN